MKRILMYENRKQSPMFWDISTPELEAAAFLALFGMLDKDWKCYEASPPTAKQRPWYEAAKAGDGAAAQKLLRARRDWEYEEWSTHEVQP